MRLRNHVSCVCVVLVGWAAAWLPAVAYAGGGADLVKLVPQDAWGFAVVRSLDNADAKARLVQQKLGLPPMPLMPMLMNMLQLGETLDTSSPLGVIALDYNQYGNEGIVFLVPANDPKALVETLKAAGGPVGGEGEDEGKTPASKPADGVSECTVFGSPMYVAQKGKVVLLSPVRECTAKVLNNKKGLGAGFDKARAEAMADSDAYISLSASTITKAYKDQIAFFVQMISAQTGGSNPIEPLVKMLTEMSALDIAVTINEKGLSLAFLVTGEKDSDFQKLLAEIKNTSEPLLAWLPREKFLLVQGEAAAYSEHTEKFGGESAMVSMLLQGGPTGVGNEALSAVVKGGYALLKDIGRFAFGVSALPEGSGGMFGLTVVIETKSAGDFVSGVRKLYEQAWSISDDEDVAAMKKAFAHAADAETIAGKKVDTITVDLTQLAEDIDEDDAKNVETLLGKNLVLRFGAVDAKRVALAFGGGKKRYETIVKTVISGGDALSSNSGIKAVSTHLPSPRSGEMFIAVDAILQAFKRASSAVGEEDMISFDVPTVDAPVAWSTQRRGKVGRADLFVPMKLIDAAMEVRQKITTAGLDDFDEDEDEDSAAADSDKDDDDNDADE
ncbi:MAG: hypothetical protein ACE5F9_08525 [Phycisphaerae bacterium]